MKHLTILAALCVLLSCEKSLDESDPEATGQWPQASARLHIITRTGDEEPTYNPIKQGRIYIFDSNEKSIDLLTTDESNNSATIDLPAGNYTLYAVGSDDLSRFTLPTVSEASPTSVISCASGKIMDDLLLKSATVELGENESLNQTISLEHKVFSLTAVEVTNVPSNVTAVTLSIAPLYQSIKLDGTYVSSPTGSYQVPLTKAATGNTWQATPNQMLFPSKGTPTIKVSFTTSEGTQSYSYTASEELPANHHFTIKGTYVAAKGIALTGILTASAWGEDRTVTFNFDETSIPVAGSRYDGYDVLSVNQAARTALLRAMNNVKYTTPAANASESNWKTALNTAMEGVEKPIGATGNWRIPTYDEALLFVNNPSLYAADRNSTPAFFCLKDGSLNWLYASDIHGTPVIHLYSDLDTNNTLNLRPVITISY